MQELVNETPINVVATKYKCTRGMLQSLQQMASTFAGIVTSFCNSLQWDTLSLIVSQFKERLYFGIHRDLIDLMRLPDLNHKRARVLFDAGVTSLVELASADGLNIEKILYNAVSFDSAKKHDNENDFEADQRNEARNFFITGKSGLTVAEAAKMLIQEARKFIQYEIGVGNIKWSESVSDSKNENKMHMSYDEDNFQNVKLKYKLDLTIEQAKDKKNFSHSNKLNINRKSEENLTLETRIVHSNNLTPSNETTSSEPDHIAIEQNLNVNRDFNSNGKQHNSLQTETKVDQIKQKENLNNEEDIFKAKPLREKNIKSCLKINQKENNIKFIDDSMPLKVKEDVTSCNNEVIENNRKNIDNKNRGAPAEKRKSLENVYENLDITPPTLKKKSSHQTNYPEINVKTNLNETDTAARKSSKQELGVTPPNLITFVNENNNAVNIEENPSTSKKAQRLLKAKQLSEMKKQEWGKRQDLEQKQIDNTTENKKVPTTINTKPITTNNVDKPINNSNNYTPKTTLRTENRTNKSLNSKKISPNTPMSTYNKEKQKTPKIPRRSPRNHLIRTEEPPKITKTKEYVKSPKNDIFENEESFTINTGLKEVLKEADNFRRPSIPEYKNNSPEDEIPSSQQLIEDTPANQTSSPHSSRFLRSLRATQKIQSPKRKPSPEFPKLQKPKAIERPLEQPSSTSIELSDLSMENSLIKNPIQLNASHILSCSKVETDSSLFKSLDIIDICGDQLLFKGAFKEFMASKRLGFCLGIQQQNGKRKPIIGANLLLNQVAASEKENDPTKSYEFQIDDTNYLAGISFCISENVVYYMNMQQEGSCKGLTGEIKYKYLRMLLRSPEHTLLVYDAKEQIKILRKILKDIGEISVALEDPKVANWLLQPDKNHNLHCLVNWLF